MGKKASREAYITMSNGIEKFTRSLEETTNRVKVQTEIMNTALNSDDNAVILCEQIERFVRKMNTLISDAEQVKKNLDQRRKDIFGE